MGNQYMLSGTAQLRVAMEAARIENSKLPMMWFLYHLDFFAAPENPTQDPSPGISTVIYDGEDQYGMTTKYTVPLTRDEYGRITSFHIPGCDLVTVTYLTDEPTSFIDTVSPEVNLSSRNMRIISMFKTFCRNV